MTWLPATTVGATPLAPVFGLRPAAYADFWDSRRRKSPSWRAGRRRRASTIATLTLGVAVTDALVRFRLALGVAPAADDHVTGATSLP